MTEYLVHPQTLVFNSHRIAGFTEMIKNEEIPQWDLLEIAMEVAEEWTDNWDDGQGFGSSDGTYMLKDFIDNVIMSFARTYKTKFNPSLQIVKL